MATEAAVRSARRGGKLRGVMLGLMAATLLVPAATAWAKDSVPDWVRAAAAEKLPSYPPDTDAVVLMDDITYTVGSDGKAVEHEREVLRILRPQGRKYGVVRIWHNPDTKLNYLHVWSIGPDGREYQVKDNEMVEQGSYEDSDLYNDEVARAANAPGRDPGGVVAFEYEQRCEPYLNEQSEDLRTGIPVHHETLTLRLPQGFEYRAVWKGMQEVAPTSSEANVYMWEFHDQPAINLHDVHMAPDADSLYPRITLHYFSPAMTDATRGDWKSEGEMVSRLNADRIVPTPAITAEAQALTAGKTDFFDKAMALGQYVQKFRYFDIELGIGGLQPHYAGDIFQHKYGDCKDKATVLEAMLQAVGIHAAGVIVDHRRGVVSPTDPSQIGDHEISAIEIPAGYTSPRMHSVVTTKSGKRYLIFDPTWPYIPFGDIESLLQGSYALIADGADSDLVQIPVLSPEESRVERTGNFKIGEDDMLTGSVSSRYFGDESEEWRYIFQMADAVKKKDAVQDWLGNFVSNFTLTSFDSSYVDALNQELHLKIDFTAAGYARAMGSMLLVRPCVVGLIDYDIDTKPRKYPVELGDASTIHDDYTITLPAGYKVDDLPDPVKVDDGFASYESKTTVDGNTLHYTRTFVQRAVELPPEKYDDLRKLDEIISNDQRSEVVLKKAI